LVAASEKKRKDTFGQIALSNCITYGVSYKLACTRVRGMCFNNDRITGGESRSGIATSDGKG